MLGKVIVVLLIGVCGVYIGISNNEINQSTKREVKGKYYEELGLVGIKGGEFLMGSDSTEAYAQDFEGPVRKVKLLFNERTQNRLFIWIARYLWIHFKFKEQKLQMKCFRNLSKKQDIFLKQNVLDGLLLLKLSYQK